MAVALHTSLITSLSPLAASLDTQRLSQLGESSISGAKFFLSPPVPATELTSAIEAIWDPIWVQYESAQSSAVAEKKLDVIRTLLEVVGRDLVVVPVVEEQLPDPSEADEKERSLFLSALADRLDIFLTLSELVYARMDQPHILEPGELFTPLIEELVELLPVEIWRDMWKYIESRSKRFTKDMPASKGKALPLLRTINGFQRFLPRTPEDLVLRGRVHQFASGVIRVAERSAINMRGDYNDIKTTWEEDEVHEDKGEGDAKAEGEGERDGDVVMEETKPVKADDAQEVKPGAEPDFYSTLWSLQQYFANPPSLDGPPTGNPAQTPFQQFKSKTDFVLPKLFEETQKEKATSGVEQSPSKKRKRDDAGASDRSSLAQNGVRSGKGGFFHPRYLTGKRLLSHELADISFRRQILVQYFILFQFLLNLTPSSAAKQAFTGGMPKTFVIGQEDQEWVTKKITAIKEELRKMGRDGKRFEATVLSTITRERHYAQWKNEGCPEGLFEVPPMDDSTATEAASGWKKLSAAPPRYPFKVGSRPLSLLWRNGFENIDQLKGWKRSSTLAGLESEIKQIEEGEADDRAMGKDIPPEATAPMSELKTKILWRGLRLASQTNLRHFGALAKKRDLQLLSGAIRAEEERAIAVAAQASQTSEQPNPSSEVAEATDAAEAVEASEATEAAEAAGTAESKEDGEDREQTSNADIVDQKGDGPIVEETIGDVEVGRAVIADTAEDGSVDANASEMAVLDEAKDDRGSSEKPDTPTPTLLATDVEMSS